MNYTDKLLLKKASTSMIAISILALVIVILSQINTRDPQVTQVLGAFTQNTN